MTFLRRYDARPLMLRVPLRRKKQRSGARHDERAIPDPEFFVRPLLTAAELSRPLSRSPLLEKTSVDVNTSFAYERPRTLTLAAWNSSGEMTPLSSRSLSFVRCS